MTTKRNEKAKKLLKTFLAKFGYQARPFGTYTAGGDTHTHYKYECAGCGTEISEKSHDKTCFVGQTEKLLQSQAGQYKKAKTDNCP